MNKFAKFLKYALAAKEGRLWLKTEMYNFMISQDEFMSILGRKHFGSYRYLKEKNETWTLQTHDGKIDGKLEIR